MKMNGSDTTKNGVGITYLVVLLLLSFSLGLNFAILGPSTIYNNVVTANTANQTHTLDTNAPVPAPDVPFAQTEAENPQLLRGGEFAPPHANGSSLIIIPYRARVAHLRIFVHYIHPFLRRTGLRYRILVVEQSGTGLFNRAKLLNIGATLGRRLGDWDCLVFHDVDLLPLDPRIPYACHPKRPSHLAVAMSKYHYKLPYTLFVGGVMSMRRRVYEAMHGFANEFYGWGGEDDDIAYRLADKM